MRISLCEALGSKESFRIVKIHFAGLAASSGDPRKILKDLQKEKTILRCTAVTEIEKILDIFARLIRKRFRVLYGRRSIRALLSLI